MILRDIRLYLSPTKIIDSDHREIQGYAAASTDSCTNEIEKAIKLYLAVRDGIRYDPYLPFHLPEHYQASRILASGRGFCIPKASLLCALARASNIPARVGFATVRNHLATRELIEFIGSDRFVYHAFVDLYLEGKWVKATPAFNRELCLRHKVEPLEFNGRDDSLFQPYNTDKQKYMEYIDQHGTFADIPVSTIVAEWKKAYGEDRVLGWISAFEEKGTIRVSSFERENIWKG